MKFLPACSIVPTFQMKMHNDGVMEVESLKLLEAKIGRILDRHEEVRREKEALAQRLHQNEERFTQLTSQMEKYEEERRELRVRLEKILNRLSGVDES